MSASRSCSFVVIFGALKRGDFLGPGVSGSNVVFLATVAGSCMPERPCATSSVAIAANWSILDDFWIMKLYFPGRIFSKKFLGRWLERGVSTESAPVAIEEDAHEKSDQGEGAAPNINKAIVLYPF